MVSDHLTSHLECLKDLVFKARREYSYEDTPEKTLVNYIDREKGAEDYTICKIPSLSMARAEVGKLLPDPVKCVCYFLIDPRLLRSMVLNLQFKYTTLEDLQICVKRYNSPMKPLDTRVSLSSSQVNSLKGGKARNQSKPSIPVHNESQVFQFIKSTSGPSGRRAESVTGGSIKRASQKKLSASYLSRDCSGQRIFEDAALPSKNVRQMTKSVFFQRSEASHQQPGIHDASSGDLGSQASDQKKGFFIVKRAKDTPSKFRFGENRSPTLPISVLTRDLLNQGDPIQLRTQETKKDLRAKLQSQILQEYCSKVSRNPVYSPELKKRVWKCLGIARPYSMPGNRTRPSKTLKTDSRDLEISIKGKNRSHSVEQRRSNIFILRKALPSSERYENLSVSGIAMRMTQPQVN